MKINFRNIFKNWYDKNYSCAVKYKGYKIYNVDESREQCLNTDNLNIEIYNDFLRNTIDYFKKEKLVNVNDNYIVYNQKYKFGVYLSWQSGRFYQKGFGLISGFFDNATMSLFLDLIEDRQVGKKLFIKNMQDEHNVSFKEAIEVYDKTQYYRYEFEEPLNTELFEIGVQFYRDEGETQYTFELIKL